jgi:hypothetical protein
MGFAVVKQSAPFRDNQQARLTEERRNPDLGLLYRQERTSSPKRTFWL